MNDDNAYRQLYHSILARIQNLDNDDNIYADIEVRVKKLRLQLKLPDFKKELIELFSSYPFPKGYFEKQTPKEFINSCIEDVEIGNKKKIEVSFDPLSNVKTFYNEKPFFYDKSKIFWMWDKKECKYEIVDETDIMNDIEDALGLYGQTIGSKIKAEYLEAFKRVGRKNIPKETPVKWIQFKDKAYSLMSGNFYDVTPDYFFTNPIPWEMGDSEDTPVIDRLFEEWVGKDLKIDLYEIIAYCCYRDYPIQTLFCLCGSGRNGKSQYMKLINKFLGNDNISSSELDMLANPSSRFESIKLYKKLMCSMGETNFGVMENTSLIKKLVGGDLIGFEVKNKTPFNDYNYAKIIIGSNSLPISADTSDGFMRRWHIIDFPNEFPEGKDIISSIPEEEYNNLARKITTILKVLLERCKFKNQGSIEDRKLKYMMASNPLPIFIETRCEKKHENFVLYNKLYTEYVKYLFENKKRKVSSKEFKAALDDEGLYLEKTTKFVDGESKNGTFVIGINICDKSDKNANNYNSLPHGELSVKESINVTNVTNNDRVIEEFIDTGIVKGSLDEFKGILNKKLGKEPEEIINLEKSNIFDGFSDNFDKYLQKCLKDGLIFEPKAGFIQRLD